MCERYSWIEKDGAVLFLTPYDVYETKRGKELQAYSRQSEDYVGHGAIRFYFDLSSNSGVEKECIDFSTPDNFPPDLVRAIKAGKMWDFGIVGEMRVMLTDKAQAEYDKVRVETWAEYDKACTEVWAIIWTNPANRISVWR